MYSKSQINKALAWARRTTGISVADSRHGDMAPATLVRHAASHLGVCSRCVNDAIGKRVGPLYVRQLLLDAIERSRACPHVPEQPAPAVDEPVVGRPSGTAIGMALAEAQDRVRVVDAGSDGWMTVARGEHGRLRFAVVRPSLEQANAVADCHRALVAAAVLDLCPVCSDKAIREQANGSSRQRLQAAIDSGCSCSPAARKARQQARDDAQRRSAPTFAARMIELQDATGCVISTFVVDGNNAEPAIFRALRQALPDDCDAARAIDSALPDALTVGAVGAALRVLCYTPEIATWLADHDPQSLTQTLVALAQVGADEDRGFKLAHEALRRSAQAMEVVAPLVSKVLQAVESYHNNK